PAHLTIAPMRRLHDEHHGTKACNDADSRPTLRTGVRGISLTPPLDAQAGTEVHIGLLPRLHPHFAGAVYGDAVEMLARADRRSWDTGHSLYNRVQSLCAMGRGWLAVAGVCGQRAASRRRKATRSARAPWRRDQYVAKKGAMGLGSRGTNTRKGRRL